MTSTIKSANAKGRMRLWMAALCITYAIVLLQTYHLAAGALHAGRDHLIVTVTSLALAILLIGYLHLKLSVSTGDRNRLAALKGATDNENDKTTFEYRQREQEILGKLLVASEALCQEELLQATELSKATHQLVGESFVSFNWLSSEGLSTGLEIMGNLRAGGIKTAQAQEQLRQLRLTEEQVTTRLAQLQEAPTAMSLAKGDYKALLAKSKEKKEKRARAAMEQPQVEAFDEQVDQGRSQTTQAEGEQRITKAESEQRRVTVPMEIEQRNHPVASKETSAAITRSIAAHLQNEDTLALIKRMNEADEMYSLFRAQPKGQKTSRSSKKC